MTSPSFVTTLDSLVNHDELLCLHRESQNVLYHLANVCFLLSYCAPNTRYGQVSSKNSNTCQILRSNLSPSNLLQVFLHFGLIIGYLLFSTWAWNVICAPGVFAWYFAFMIINMGQLLYILYQLRPIRFEEVEQRVHELTGR